MTCMITKKGRSRYAKAEPKKFVLKIERTFGIVHHDPEPALKTLVEQTRSELRGLSVRSTPVVWKKAQGSVGNLQANSNTCVTCEETYGLDIPCNSIIALTDLGAFKTMNRLLRVKILRQSKKYCK